MAQLPGKGGGAGRAIAFANDELGRAPALVARHVKADELGDGRGVLLQAVELSGILGGYRPAVAGADGINEDQVCLIEQRELIVHQPVRWWQGRSVLRQAHTPRAQHAKVHPDRRRTGTAVERKRHPPIGKRHVFARVGDVKDRSGGLVVFVAQQDGAGAGLVLDLLATDGRGVLRLDQFLLGFLGFLLFFLFFNFSSLWFNSKESI